MPPASPRVLAATAAAAGIAFLGASLGGMARVDAELAAAVPPAPVVQLERVAYTPERAPLDGVATAEARDAARSPGVAAAEPRGAARFPGVAAAEPRGDCPRFLGARPALGPHSYRELDAAVEL